MLEIGWQAKNMDKGNSSMQMVVSFFLYFILPSFYFTLLLLLFGVCFYLLF